MEQYNPNQPQNQPPQPQYTNPAGQNNYQPCPPQQPYPPQQGKPKKPVYKKWWFWVIIVILVIILASAIGGGSDSSDNGATTPTETTTAVAAKADSNGNNIGDYTVKVKKATLCKDYLGNDAVKVVYSFTNNSKDAISFDVACTDEVYEDGIQLETAVLSNDETDLLDVKIKPGVTKDVTKAYKLSDSKTDLTVEVGQLLSFDDTKVTTTVKLSK